MNPPIRPLVDSLHEIPDPSSSTRQAASPGSHAGGNMRRHAVWLSQLQRDGRLGPLLRPEAGAGLGLYP